MASEPTRENDIAKAALRAASMGSNLSCPLIGLILFRASNVQIKSAAASNHIVMAVSHGVENSWPKILGHNLARNHPAALDINANEIK